MIMGVKLSHNFEQPYFATSIKDFWRRWHISLTSWFTTYLYIPLGGNRKGLLRKYLNIVIVFAVSGLWHGAQWNFVIWGCLHGLYQIAGDIKNRLCNNKIGITAGRSSFSRCMRQRCVTFVLVDFAWFFFAADSMQRVSGMIEQMTRCFYTSGIFELGIDFKNAIILVIALLCLWLVDIVHERGESVLQIIERQECWFRWLFYISAIWIIIMFGVYGTQYDTSQFLYFQF